MKRIGFLLLISAGLFFGCSKYDDSELWSDMKSVSNRLNILESRCDGMNEKISSLQKLIDAMQKNYSISSVSSVEGGYLVSFTNNESITIKNGKDGTTPAISAKKDTDGMWYWTVNGAWVLDNTGKKVRANGTDGAKGKDAITPQLKIENDYWYISYDNGSSWKKLEKATGEDGNDGDAFFNSVYEDNDYVYFVLADGTSISLPKEKHLSLSFKKTTMASTAEEMRVEFEVKGAANNVRVMAFADQTMAVRVVMDEGSKGTLYVKFTGADRSGNVMVVAKTEDDSCYELVEFIQGILETTTSKQLNIPVEGGEINLSVTHDMSVSAKSDSDWITPIQTKATVTDVYSFKVAKNETFAPRSGKVTVSSVDGLFELVFTVAQAQKNKLILDKHEQQINVGGKYTFNIDTNVDELEWKSSNPSVVKVDQNGEVTALGAGTVTITVSSKDGSISDKCVVTSKEFTITDYVSLVRTNIGSMYIVNGSYKVDFRIDNTSSETIYIEKIGHNIFGWYEVNRSVEGNSSYSLSIYGTSNLYSYYQNMIISWGGKSYTIAEQK